MKLTEPIENEKRKRVELMLERMQHTARCTSSNCVMPSCAKLKHVLKHSRQCKKKSKSGCHMCKQFIHLCLLHAKQCKYNNCLINFCSLIKRRLQERKSMLNPATPTQPQQQQEQLQQQEEQLQQPRFQQPRFQHASSIGVLPGVALPRTALCDTSRKESRSGITDMNRSLSLQIPSSDTSLWTRIRRSSSPTTTTTACNSTPEMVGSRYNLLSKVEDIEALSLLTTKKSELNKDEGMDTC
eukprot:gene17480-19228_t